jgi:hypothetical protein
MPLTAHLAFTYTPKITAGQVVCSIHLLFILFHGQELYIILVFPEV